MLLKNRVFIGKHAFCEISGKYWQALGRIKDDEKLEDEYNNYISDIIWNYNMYFIVVCNRKQQYRCNNETF